MHRLLPPLLATMLLLFFLIISLFGAKSDGITFDEIAHIGSGYSYITQHDYRLNPEHPPMLKVIAAIPLYFLHPTFAITHDVWSWHHAYDSGEYGQWDAGRYLLFEAGNDTDRLVFWARVPFILLSVAFGAFLYYWGRRLGSSIIGLGALALYVSDPNILGHDHLITTDIGAAAAMTIVLYYFLLFLKKPTWKNTLIFGIVFGIAQTVKFSLLTIIPFFFVMMLLWIMIQHHHKFSCYLSLLITYLRQGLIVGVLTVATIFVIYIPFAYKTPPEVLTTITPIKIHGNEPKNVATRNTILAMNRHDWLRPFTLYIHGVSQVFYRVAGGNRTYFLGAISSHADARYFPTIFLIKEPLPHLFLYITVGSLGFFFLLRTCRATMRLPRKKSLMLAQSFLRRHFTEVTLFLFIIFYTILAISSNLTIGLRHLFPIFPPLYLLTASVVYKSYHKLQRPSFRKAMLSFLIFIGLMMLVIVVRTFPFYIAYFNSLVGGTSNGYMIVTDSNTDWGQESLRLKTFLQEHNIDHIRVDYFGGDNIAKRLGTAYIPWWDSKRPVEPGWYAISATLLQDSLYSDKPLDESYSWTRHYTPQAILGGSLLLYHVTQ